MSLQFTRHDGVSLHYHYRNGAPDTPPVVFLNSLGTDFRIWQGVIDRLPDIPVLMMDKRGHGLSDLGAISIEALAQDAAHVMDELGLSGTLLCGVSVGGMIAQVLATHRPDLAAGLILSNTGAKIGDAETWDPRIKAVTRDGIEGIADAVMERWFSPQFRKASPARLAGYRNMLTRTTAQGYAGTCAAIRDADLRTSTPALTLPCICIGGTEDLATPPALVRDLSDMIDGASLEIIEGVGHLPCIEAPEIIAGHIDTLWRALT